MVIWFYDSSRVSRNLWFYQRNFQGQCRNVLIQTSNQQSSKFKFLYNNMTKLETVKTFSNLKMYYRDGQIYFQWRIDTVPWNSTPTFGGSKTFLSTYFETSIFKIQKLNCGLHNTNERKAVQSFKFRQNIKHDTLVDHCIVSRASGKI